MHKSQRLRESSNKVLLDDRKVRPGAMFADMNLIGIPYRIVFSERRLDKGMVEYKRRQE